ncbi:MAG: T9SS type A sorting domain-containing protein [Bacteroidia bacterium]
MQKFFKIIIRYMFIVAYVLSTKVYAQQFLSTPNMLLNDMHLNAINYFDSLQNIHGSSILEGEGSEYTHYMKFYHHWAPRLSGYNDFEKYYRAYKTTIDNLHNYQSLHNNTWHELGPKQVNDCVTDACYARGIGPIEQIAIFKPNPQHMLCAQTRGGVFYSDNGGQSWRSTGTDVGVPMSGMARVLFHPTDHTVWFASSGGGGNEPSFIMYHGGIFRSADLGTTWHQIADYNTLGGIWNIIHQIKIDPNNPDVLYAATEKGLYKCSNANAINPQWLQIPQLANKKIHDIEIKPDNSQIIYISVNDANGWHFMYSTNAGQSWQAVPGSVAQLSNAKLFTIEVSPAQPENVYCWIQNGDVKNSVGGCNEDIQNKIMIYNSITHNWTLFNTTANAISAYGKGYSFAVCPLTGNEIMVSCGYEAKKMIKDGLSQKITYGGNYHPDIEHFIYHPSNLGEVWMANHGGVYQSSNYGINWTDRSTGLGVAEVERMADAYKSPSHILIGAYHDGTMLTQNAYYSFWDADWKTVLGGDGMRPLIDNTNHQYMWAAYQQGYIYFSNDFGASFPQGSQLPRLNSVDFQTEAVLNKVQPNILYRTSVVNNKSEVVRSFDRGFTNEIISNFKNHPLFQNANYGVWKLYTTEYNANYLVAHLIVKNTSGNEWHYLFRTTNVNAGNPAQVQWEELPLPRNAWLQDIEFDMQDPNILYIAFSSANTLSTSPIGTNMLYKVNYFNPSVISRYTCPSGLCQDISYNLPNTGVGNDCLVLEKGTNNGMYIATDVGVFHTNQKRINNATNNNQVWRMLGLNLPRVRSNGIEINYQINKLRIATYGRGVWEGDLVCPDDPNLGFAINIPSGFYEAENNIYITANNGNLTNLGNISMRAGNEIVMTVTGNNQIILNSDIHMFIHPCNAPGNSFRQNMYNNDEGEQNVVIGSIGETKFIDPKRQVENFNFSIFPNPNTGQFTIIVQTLNESEDAQIIISDMFGKQMEQFIVTKQENQLDLTHLSKGIYLVSLFTKNTVTQTQKVIIH